jgi:hypothetical protein
MAKVTAVTNSIGDTVYILRDRGWYIKVSPPQAKISELPHEIELDSLAQLIDLVHTERWVKRASAKVSTQGDKE